MKREQVHAIADAQVDVAQLGELLGLMAKGVGEDRVRDAIEACSARASDIANQMDDIPGFAEGQAASRHAGDAMDRHGAWLTERRATLAHAETLTDGTPVHDAACIRVNELDRKIMTTAAANAAEMMAKLALLVIVNAEGAQPTPEDAARIAAEAEPFLAGEA